MIVSGDMQQKEMKEHVKNCKLCRNDEPCIDAEMIIENYDSRELVDSIGDNWFYYKGVVAKRVKKGACSLTGQSSQL